MVWNNFRPFHIAPEKIPHMGKLTDVKCRNARCDGQKILKLGDGQGLYLWVHDSGRKHFHFRYSFDGKPKGVNLGDYPETSLAEARRKCKDQRELLEQGIDPSEARKRVKREQQQAEDNSFRAVAMEWYETMEPSWTVKHAADVLRRLEKNIFPEIGDRPIGEIDGPELLRVIRKMESRGATDLAHKVNSNCGQVFRYGIAVGKCRFDIAASVVDAMRPHMRKNQPSVNPKQVPALMQAISKYEEIGELQVRLGLQLLAHTFTRTVELIHSHKTEFDLQEMTWEIPADRMKLKRPHLVPLTDQSVAIVEQLIDLSGKSAFLLPGRNILKPISNNTLLFALYRLGYKGVMTGHGFRAMASTILNEAGWNPDWVEKQLAHEEENKVRGAYNRAQYLQGRRQMMEWWSEYLVAAEQGKPLPASPYAAA
jgi:integrase